MSLFSHISNYATEAKTSLTTLAGKAEVDLSNAKNSVTTNISKFTDYAEDKASYVATQAGALGTNTYDAARDAFSLTPAGLIGYWYEDAPNPGIAAIKGLGGKALDSITTAIDNNPTASTILNGIEFGGELATIGALALGGYLLYEAFQHKSEIYGVAKKTGGAAFGIGLDFVPGGGVVKDLGQQSGFL